MERYKRLGSIGSGGSGIVDKYIDRQTDSVVAVKSIILRYMDESHRWVIQREISVLKALKHDNVVRLLNVVHTKDASNLVFEFLDLNLANFIYHWHRSISSYSMPDSMTQAQVDSHIVKVVTPAYRPPELLCLNGDGEYSTAVDIWSVGCIFGEMVNIEHLITGRYEAELFDTIYSLFRTNDWPDIESLRDNASQLETLSSQNTKKLAKLVPNIDSVGLDLLSKMLSVNPRHRITADEALNHPYFENVHSFQFEYINSN